MFKPEKRQVSFESNPPGAAVFVDTTQVGVTPVKARLLDGYAIEVRMEKEGYAPVTETVHAHEDTFWLIMQNIPFPILGSVFASNFENMSILDKTEVVCNLEPEKGK